MRLAGPACNRGDPIEKGSSLALTVEATILSRGLVTR